MFREVSRIKNALQYEDSIKILKEQKRGVLSLIGDNGYPYGVPLNHYYSQEDGKLYFHSGKKGHKIDAMSSCDKASYCVYDEGEKKEGEWALYIKSVIVFGHIEVINDIETVERVSRLLSHKFTHDEKYIDSEIKKSLDATYMFALVPEHITGKRVHEA